MTPIDDQARKSFGEPEEHTMSTEDDRKAKQILAAFEPLAGMGEKAECCERIFSDYGVSHACVRKAKTIVNGKPYCGVHDPVRREAKAKERDRLWRERSAAKWADVAETRRRSDCFDDLLAACNRALADFKSLNTIAKQIGIHPYTQAVAELEAAIARATK
jgi:hypothetical protein